jgi:hypothetical protein
MAVVVGCTRLSLVGQRCATQANEPYAQFRRQPRRRGGIPSLHPFGWAMTAYLLLGVLTGASFLFSVNEFLRGRREDLLDAVLMMVMVGCVVAGFVTGGWRRGLLLMVVGFLLVGLLRPVGLRLAARLLAIGRPGTQSHPGLPPERLRRISAELGRSVKAEDMIQERMNDSPNRSTATRVDLFEYCGSNPETRAVLAEFGCNREGLTELYQKLLASGAGQWAGGHWVAASAIAYPETLRFLLAQPTAGREVAYLLIDHFETGAPLVRQSATSVDGVGNATATPPRDAAAERIVKAESAGVHQPKLPLSGDTPTVQGTTKTRAVVSWEEVLPLAEEAFNIFTGCPELYWAERSWGYLTKAGLVNGGSELHRVRAYIRLLVLASLYRDWCELVWDEAQDDEPWFWLNAVGVNPVYIGQLAGPKVKLSKDQQCSLDEAVSTLMRRERPAVVNALFAGFGSAEDLFVALWRSNQYPDDDTQDDDDEGDGTEPVGETDADILNYDLTTAKLAAYQWMRDGCESRGPIRSRAEMD